MARGNGCTASSPSCAPSCAPSCVASAPVHTDPTASTDPPAAPSLDAPSTASIDPPAVDGGCAAGWCALRAWTSSAALPPVVRAAAPSAVTWSSARAPPFGASAAARTSGLVLPRERGVVEGGWRWRIVSVERRMSATSSWYPRPRNRTARRGGSIARPPATFGQRRGRPVNKIPTPTSSPNFSIKSPNFRYKCNFCQK